MCVCQGVWLSPLLPGPAGGEENGSQDRAEAAYEACVDIKRFSQVLSSQFVPMKAICSEWPPFLPSPPTLSCIHTDIHCEHIVLCTVQILLMKRQFKYFFSMRTSV